MEQVLGFIGNHPLLTGAFAVVLAALIATELGRLSRRWKELETHQAILLINRQDPLILDVSNSTDHAEAHILNAQHMPPSRIEAGNQTLMKAKDRPILIYCKNNQVAPQMATRLTKLGFEQVHVLKGGLSQWRADNQPVTRGKGKKKHRDKPKSQQSKKSKKSAEASNADAQPSNDPSNGRSDEPRADKSAD